MLTRRARAAARLALALAAPLAGVGCHPPPSGPPSLLLVTIDTLRPDYLGMNGYDRDTSPFLDAWLARGTYFDRAITPVPRTTPALASLMTGAYPHRTRVRTLTDRLDPRLAPLAEILKGRGYRTLAVVSHHLLGPERGLDRGFERYDLKSGLRTAEATTAAALAHLSNLRRRHPDAPLFAWVHYVDPHTPYHPSERLAADFDPGYRGRYAKSFGWQPRPGEPGTRLRPYPEDLPKREVVHRNRLPDRVNEHVRRLYAGEIRMLDDALARLVTGFEEALDGHLIAVFTADHGESLGEHGYFYDHGDYVYEPGLRVPLGIVMPNAPRRTAPAHCPVPVSLVDVAPTLLELLGQDPAALGPGSEGRSLAACVRGGPLEAAPVFSESGRANFPEQVARRVHQGVEGRFRSVRLGDWKLIWTPFRDEAEAFELYDLESDPGEQRDLYAPDHPQALRLRAELDRWMASDDDAPPTKEPTPEDRVLLRGLGYVE